MIVFSWYKPIHVWLVKNHPFFVKLFSLLVYSILAFIVLGFIFYQQLPLIFYEIGSKVGTLAVAVYSLTLMPGILKRLNQLPFIRASLFLFRRQLGVLAFLLILLHSSFVVTIPSIQEGVFIPQLNTRQTYGVIAMWLLFPLWLTSNNFSAKKLGKFWGVLHKLTYLALFFVMLHVALLSLKTGAVLLLVLIAEIVSWINKLFCNKK
jgi:DMSO/TMAO reductase YedYZ heme-binding membrane subunit